MKKPALFILSAFVLLLTATNCVKTDVPPQPSIQDISASIKSSETYTFVLPASNNSNNFQIVSQASNSEVSVITTNASGNAIYQYTPAANFTGTDNIVISNVEEPVNKCGDIAKGGCFPNTEHKTCDNKSHEQKPAMIIKININVLANK